MHIEQGNIVDQFGKSEIVIATTNSCITKHGRLVMGTGNASAIDNVTDCEFSKFAGAYLNYKYKPTSAYSKTLTYGFEMPHCTEYITKWPWYNPQGHYLVNGSAIGILQVKYYFADNAPLELVRFSVDQLTEFARKDALCTIACAFPAIGKGGLTMDKVLPILLQVPNNVTFYIL